MQFFSITLQKIFGYRVQILWAIVIILSIYFLYFSFKHASQPTHGFASYYTASRLLLEGESVVNFYDDNWFSSKVEVIVPGIYEIYLVNMPTTALIFLPIANFDYETVKIIWTVFNLVFLAVILGIVVKRMNFGEFWLPLYFILFLTFQPLYANIFYGQVYVFIFCILTLAWFAYESGNELLLGISIGFVFILKTGGLFLLVLLIIKKKWKSLIWFFAIVVVLFFVTLPILGLDSWLAYGNKLLSYRSSPTLSVTAYQSVHSFFHHFFVFDEQWNPVPLINLVVLGKSLTFFFTAMILVISIIFAFKKKKSDLLFATFIIVGIILSPPSIDYHYMLMLIPIIILFNRLINSPSIVLWIIFVISYLLIAVSLPYISAKITDGILAVFAYPKLYAALGLWAMSLRAFDDSNFPEEILSSRYSKY